MVAEQQADRVSTPIWSWRRSRQQVQGLWSIEAFVLFVGVVIGSDAGWSTMGVRVLAIVMLAVLVIWFLTPDAGLWDPSDSGRGGGGFGGVGDGGGDGGGGW